MNTGTGSGTLRLDVRDTVSITDLDGNAIANVPFTSGESYTMNGGERSDNIMVSRTADFNGDGKAEIAVFRPANSTWYIRRQGDFVYSTVGDIPCLPITTGMGRQTLLSSCRLKANGTEVLLKSRRRNFFTSAGSCRHITLAPSCLF